MYIYHNRNCRYNKITPQTLIDDNTFCYSVISRYRCLMRWIIIFKHLKSRLYIYLVYQFFRLRLFEYILTIDNVARVNEIIQSNRRVTVDEIAETIGISFGSAHEIITERLEYRKVCARWVPRLLTEMNFWMK